MRRLGIGKYRHKGFIIINVGRHSYGKYEITRGEKFFSRATDLKDAIQKINGIKNVESEKNKN